MRAVDASSTIHAWDNYPVNQFPPLWNWLGSLVTDQLLVMPKVGYGEVVDKMPECAKWLKERKIKLFEETNEIALEAMRIKSLLGIQNDKYHSKGVGENDILIIATAKCLKIDLVSEESRQLILPDKLPNCKIPAVCGLEEVSVRCINFIELIRESNVVFQ